ncbi:MAG: FtsH protease activity modulator HflK [Desulfobulbaceae bacterium]|nr:MAG: FtsH protease activity modulator HflK [Desulfobulbaceae bacterium]
MSWQDEQPQWGKKKGPSSPEDLIAALLKKIKEGFDGGGNKGDGPGGTGSGGPDFKGGLTAFGLIFLVIALIVVGRSSFYILDEAQGERGVVLRLGKFYTLTEPGPHFKMPFIDEVFKVSVSEVRKEEFGFRSRPQGQKSVFAKSGYTDESLMLTGDKNVIDVEWIVQYLVRDPYKFAFKVRNVPQAVRDVSEKVMRAMVGNYSFDYVLNNREILGEEVARNLQKTLNEYDSGVYISEVRLKDVTPPDTVKPAFNEVNEADQDMKRLVNEAEQQYNKIIPKARGNAKKIIEEAHGYAIGRTNAAEGDTSRFLSVLAEYEKAKNVTRNRIYLETMANVLPKVNEIYVIDKDQRSLLPLLNLTGAKK